MVFLSRTLTNFFPVRTCKLSFSRNLHQVQRLKHTKAKPHAVLVNLNRVSAYAFHNPNSYVPHYVANLLVRICEQRPTYLTVLSEGDAAWQRRDAVIQDERKRLQDQIDAGELEQSVAQGELAQLDNFPNFRETYLSKTSTIAINQYYKQLELLTKGLGISWIHSTLEADLVISKLCEEFVADGASVSIVTPSKLLQQLIRPEVELIPPRNIFLPDLPVLDLQHYLEANKDLAPSKIPDLLALVGVPSLGIPGIKGVGRITAFKLLEEHKDVEGVLAAAQAGKIKQAKVCEAIAARGRTLGVSKRLLVLDSSQVDLGFSLDDLLLKNCDPEALAAVSKEINLDLHYLVR